MSIESLEYERDALRREIRGLQEMLYQVLNEIGEPVVVSRETMEKGVDHTKRIAIDNDTDNEAFVFFLEDV